jgi:hypothetical protein
VLLTPAANLLWVSLTLMAIYHLFSATPAVWVAKFDPSVLKTVLLANFAAGVVETGGKFATGVVDSGGTP